MRTSNEGSDLSQGLEEVTLQLTSGGVAAPALFPALPPP